MGTLSKLRHMVLREKVSGVLIGTEDTESRPTYR